MRSAAANAYYDLIRFLGVLCADLMRAMLRAEELADEEALLQVTTGAAGPTMAPHIAARHVTKNACQGGDTEERDDLVEIEIEGEEEAWMANASEVVDITEMVEGWLDDNETAPPLEDEEGDYCSHMQVAAKVGPTTAFASYLARLQAHFESMTKQQSANVIHHLHQKLEEWRGEWIMALTSVSRDRADRLWALLVTYQGEPDCITDQGRNWAESRWKEVAEMLQLDAVRAASIDDFRLPNRSRIVQVEDTQREQASSSGDVLVRRRPGEPWTEATKEEKDELRRHDDEVRAEETRQAEHDEWLWQNHQAMEARSWDEWAMKTEMEGATRQRPLKRFRVKIAVTDSEHNELAVADLRGEVDVRDVPQVNVVVQERIVQVPVQEELEQQQESGDTSAEGKGNGEEKVTLEGKKEDAAEDDRAETVAVASPAEEMDEIVDNEMTDLEAILETVMGREWFQLFVHRQVDAEMVRKRWGTTVLEIFQVNRDMMDMAEEQEKHGVGPRAMEMRMGDGDVNIRHMSEDDSSASSGAKVFPEREVVAGRRDQDGTAEMDAEQAAAECEGDEPQGLMDVAAEGDGRPTANQAMDGAEENERQIEESQQILEDTQLEPMDVMDGGGAAATTASGTASSTEGIEGDSYGSGKVQTDLRSWLK